MAAVGECSVRPMGRDVFLPGIMYVSGYIMSFNEEGNQGIMSVRGGGGKFVIFQKKSCYINGVLHSQNKKLYERLKQGSVISVLMEDLGKLVKASTFSVRYMSRICWVGDFPYCNPYMLNHPELLVEATENPTIFDIRVDVPLSDLKEHSGTVYWACNNYGLVSVRPRPNFIQNVLCTPQVLFMNGNKVPMDEKLPVFCIDRFLHVYAKIIPPVWIFGVKVTFEAVLAWYGSKPNIKLVCTDRRVTQPLTDTCTEQNEFNQIRHKPIERNNCIPSLHNCTVTAANTLAPPPLLSQLSLPPQCSAPSTSLPSPSQTDSVGSLFLKPAMKSSTYMTGTFQGIAAGFYIFGPIRQAARFSVDNLMVNGKTMLTVGKANSHLLNTGKQSILHGYVVDLKEPIKVDKYTILWEALYVWMGPAPEDLKTAIRSLKNLAEPTEAELPIKPHADAVPTTNQVLIDHQCDMSSGEQVHEEILIDRRDLIKCEQVTSARPISRGRVSGYVLSASSADVIMTGFTNTVYISREHFYVDGRKFRGVSLLEYFQKNYTQKVSTYLVPMKATKVRGVVVLSKAICAWVGKEPAELQKLIGENKRNTNSEMNKVSRNEKNCFYYFVGRVSKIGKNVAVMECDIEGQHEYVSFAITDLYKHGKKVNENSTMAVHEQTLLPSRWSLLAYYTEECVVPGVKFAAVAVWHYENQPQLMDEFHLKLPLWQRHLTQGSCECHQPLKDLLQQPFSHISKGIIMEKKPTEVSIFIKNEGLVWVPLEKLYVDGCSCCLSQSDEQRPCHVVLVSGKQTAIYAWIGKQPSIKKTDHYHGMAGQVNPTDSDSDCDEPNSGGHDDEKYFEDVYEDIENDETSESSSEEQEDEEKEEEERDMNDACDPYDLITIVTRNTYAPIMLKNNKNNIAKSKQSRKKAVDFYGKHITGKIERIDDNAAVVWWTSFECGGSALALLDLKCLFIYGTPFSKEELRGKDFYWKNVSCQMYINTLTKVEQYGMLEVSSRATVGWVGNKPVIVPPPGKQKPGQFHTSKLRIAYSDPPGGRLQFCSVKQWNVIREHVEHHRKRLSAKMASKNARLSLSMQQVDSDGFARSPRAIANSANLVMTKADHAVEYSFMDTSNKLSEMSITDFPDVTRGSSSGDAYRSSPVQQQAYYSSGSSSPTLPSM